MIFNVLSVLLLLGLQAVKFTFRNAFLFVLIFAFFIEIREIIEILLAVVIILGVVFVRQHISFELILLHLLFVQRFLELGLLQVVDVLVRALLESRKKLLFDRGFELGSD